MANSKTPFGAPIFASNLPPTTGTYFFVHSVTGSDGNTGLKSERPLATVNAAILKCTAAKNDVIVLMPGHAETVTATSIAHNVEGVTVVGLGTGLKRPTFTYGAAAATITASAANGSWSNCHFIANFLNVAAAFTLGAAKDFTIDNCSFVDVDSTHNFLSIVVTGSTANAADGLTFTKNYVYGQAVTDGAVLSILGNTDRLLAADNFVDKAATNDAGHFMTQAALVCKGARVLRNILNVVGATNAAVGLFATGSSTTNSGVLAYNLVTSLDTTSALFITAALNYAVHENYVSGVVAASGVLWPTADTVS